MLTTHHGFIVGRYILHNVLNVQIATDYSRNAYDHVNWSFVSGLMDTMGFGRRIASYIY